MPFAATQMDLESIILSEANQRKIAYITYMWTLKMNLFAKQKQTHRHRKQTYGCQRRGQWDKLGAWF